MCIHLRYPPPPPPIYAIFVHDREKQNKTKNNTHTHSGDDQARDFRGKIPADVIGEAQELPAGVEPDEELVEIIRRTLAGGMDLAQDACAAADEVGGWWGVVCVSCIICPCMYCCCPRRFLGRREGVYFFVGVLSASQKLRLLLVSSLFWHE